MTKTSVQEVSAGAQFFQNMKGNGAQKISNSGDVFQDVLNREAGQNAEKPERDERVAQPTKADKSRELPNKQNFRADRVKSKAVEADGQQVPETEDEDAEELVAVAVNQIFQMITEVFHVDAKELQDMMDELGLELPDLLNAEKLGALLLQTAGETDSFALVTNEELYSGFRQVMDLRENLEARLPENIAVDADELPEASTQMDFSLEAKETAGDTDNNLQNGLTQKDMPQTVKEDKQAEEPQQNHSTAAADHIVSVVVENTENSEAASRSSQTSEVTMGYDTDTQNIMRQILDYMKVSLKPEENHLVMQLHPASLGSIQVQLASKGGMVTAQFIAENELVKAAIESQMTALKEQFEQQGVRVEAIEVSVQTHLSDRNMGQDREQAGQSQERRERTRRIRTDAVISGDSTMEEARQASDSPENSGSQIDYMA